MSKFVLKSKLIHVSIYYILSVSYIIALCMNLRLAEDEYMIRF
jgi:hypothetical protein